MRLLFVLMLAMTALFSYAVAGMCAEPDDPSAAIKAAKSEGMPLFVDIGSHSCAACKKMFPVLESLEKRLEGKVAVMFIDSEKHRSYAVSLGVMAIPTQILYGRDGKEAGRNVGYISEEDALGMMREKGLIK